MSSSRLHEVISLLRPSDDEAIMVTNAADIRWLTGFTGSNGAVLVAGSRSVLFTDGRYTVQAAIEAPSTEVRITSGSSEANLIPHMVSLRPRRVWVQMEAVSFSLVESLKKQLPSVIPVDIASVFSKLRARKTSQEVGSIKTALAITEQTFSEVLPFIKEGISENQLAAEIDYRQRVLGAEGSSFDTIVAFGPNSALPHARPGGTLLQRGTPILMDFGCFVDGYASDMTRMVHFGPASSKFVSAYDAVHSALQEASKRVSTDMSGAELDGIARQVLTKQGLGDLFSHSLGHGVGLEIHEWPGVSSRNKELLPSECVITLEPGVYLPGNFGIRIENMVHLSPKGIRTLNTLSTDLVIL